MTEEQEKAHQEAVERGDRTYVDPVTGHRVMTALWLEQRGYCCMCGCRHCPWGYEIPATCTAFTEKAD